MLCSGRKEEGECLIDLVWRLQVSTLDGERRKNGNLDEFIIKGRA